MNRFTRLTILSAMTLGLAACGGGAKLGGGKEGAAQAAFQASQPAGRGYNKTGQSLVEKALASGATSITLTADCAQGGSASLKLDVSANRLDGLVSYSITYDACNEDGQNEYNGTMETALGLDLDLDPRYTKGAFIISMKGKLTIDGEISDFIDVDAKMSMDFAATSMHTGSVKLVVDGSIETSEGKFTYSHETVAITAGELPKA